MRANVETFFFFYSYNVGESPVLRIITISVCLAIGKIFLNVEGKNRLNTLDTRTRIYA